VEGGDRGRRATIRGRYQAANPFLGAGQAGIPLAHALGGGLVASIDGMRFIVPGGRPGDRITGRPIRSDVHPLGLPIATPLDRVATTEIRPILSSTTAQWLGKPFHDISRPRASASSGG